jgi:hypothetical protein
MPTDLAPNTIGPKPARKENRVQEPVGGTAAACCAPERFLIVLELRAAKISGLLQVSSCRLR